MVHSHRLSLLSLIVGVVFGCSLVILLNQSLHLSTYQVNNNIAPDYNSQFPNQENQSSENYSTNKPFPDEEGTDLYKSARVLCWIMTSPENHKTKALAVKETWGNRCNIILFMSSESDSTLPTVQLPVREGRNQLWGKTREAFRYIWNHYRDQADWFLKADDDTYVIVENLRYFLSAFSTSDALWFGHKYKAIVEKGYFSGGAGYVLSKEAVRRFVEEGYFNSLICRHDHEGAEDAEMGKCMQNMNVSAMDTRDSKGRGRFFPFVPEQHLFPGKITAGYWYWNNIYYPPKQGSDCCSDSAISFHYVNPQQMRLLDYLIYQLRPFGMKKEQRPSTPEPPPDLELTATPWIAPNETVTLSTAETDVANASIIANTTDLLTNITGAQNLTIITSFADILADDSSSEKNKDSTNTNDNEISDKIGLFLSRNNLSGDIVDLSTD